MTELDSLLSSEKANKKQFESMIGKLNHAAFIIPLSRYFLNRLSHNDFLSKKFGPQKLRPGTKKKKDIHLLKDLWSIMSAEGSSIRNMTHMTHSLPAIFCWSCKMFGETITAWEKTGNGESQKGYEEGLPSTF